MRLVGGTMLAAAAILVMAGILSAEDQKQKVTTLRIPKTAKAPVIDGKIGKDEWQGAAAITGFINFGYPGMSIPQMLQPVWYVSYDDSNFYLAFHYPVYPKGSLRAKCKTKTVAESPNYLDSILLDDHTEIEICNTSRDKAVSGYFYKFMTNPWDMVCDQKVRYSIGQWGYEYDSGALVKSVFTEDYWDQELAIPLKDLDVKKINDGDKWVLQLVSAQDPGSNYFAWVVASWLQFHMFPEIVFDSQAAAVQFLGVGDWMNGNPDFKFALCNSSPSDAEISIGVSIFSSDGKNIFEKTDKVPIKKGESKEQVISARGLQLQEILGEGGAKKDNKVVLKIADASGKVYYDHEMPIRKHTVEVERYVKNLVDLRRPAQPRLEFAYMPGSNRLIARSDIGILGMDPKISQAAKYFSATVEMDEGFLSFDFDDSDDMICRNTVPFRADGTAEIVFSFPPLGEGLYEVEMSLLDADGKSIVARKDSFEKKSYPFESFKGGLAETVMPPYTPVEAKVSSFTTVGNTYEIGENGLPSQIRNHLIAKEAGQEILAGPVTLSATSGGKTANLAGDVKKFSWSRSDVPTRVKGSAEGQLAGLEVKIKSEADYTGQYLVEMELSPKGKPEIESLELEIPLAGAATVSYAYSPRDSSMVFSKENPWKADMPDGVIWDNIKGNCWPFIMFAGNGEKGLYWYTDSYEGFWLDRNYPHILLEKKGAVTSLKIRLINRKSFIAKPRKLRFALIAVPVKPLPPKFREMAYDSERMHIGGASWWGTIGTFVFPKDDSEWQGWMAGKKFEYKGSETPGAYPLGAPPQGTGGPVKGKEYGAYRAADLIGWLQPEFQGYAGEWVGTTNPPLCPDASLLHYTDKGKNPLWPEPEQRAVYLKDACVQSFYDFEAYIFYLSAKNAGIGGYWWDWNSLVNGNSLEKGTMYLNDEGVPEPRCNIFMVRKFYERVARIDHELGIPNTNNVYSPGAVYHMPWLSRINAWESMYLESSLDDMFDAHGVDKYRSIIGKYTGLPVQIVMNIPISWQDARARTVIALSLLHDNGIFGFSWDKKQFAKFAETGILDDAYEWIPYWRSAKEASSPNKEILISVYKHKTSGRKIVAAVNPSAADVDTELIVGESLKSAKDLEDSSDLKLQGGKIPQLKIKRHDFRLVVAE